MWRNKNPETCLKDNIRIWFEHAFLKERVLKAISLYNPEFFPVQILKKKAANIFKFPNFQTFTFLLRHIFKLTTASLLRRL